MKKKNLAILLLLPYLISLVGIITVNITFKTFPQHISHIEWEYSDIEVFKLAQTRYRLKAKGVTSSNYPLADGNELTWEVVNQDGTEEPYARIDKENGEYYLVPLAEGAVTLTCRTVNGNVSRHTTAIIYLNSVIVVRTAVQSSQNNIDPTVYYGEYDLVGGQKTAAKIDLDILCVPDELSQTLHVESKTENIKIDTVNEHVEILGEGPAYFTLAGGIEAENTLTSFTYSFQIVDNGVNVYTYEDLLNCTNRSANGEIVVLRKSFESKENAYQYANGKLVTRDGKPVKKANNVECFGTYDHSQDIYNFKNEIYSFETTYNQSYIQQWNSFVREKNIKFYSELTNRVNVGLRVQKDFYGNGYTLNLHNLTFPYETTPMVDSSTGNTVDVPTLRNGENGNLFRGPLHFYTLGKPDGNQLITAYGQDNIGMYVNGDNITVNDVNMKNCDFGNSFTFLEYTGTVLEVYGDNVTVKNSVLQNGKNVMRAYSSDSTVLQNCMLQNAQNFLLMVGCNEYIPLNLDQTFVFKDWQGNEISTTLKDFISAGSAGDKLLEVYLLGADQESKQMFEIAKMQAALQALQAAMNDTGAETLPVGGSMEVRDSLFYRSGISSIAMESFFNGPFLYSSIPSMIGELFAIVSDDTGYPLVPLLPENVSGISYPVTLNVTGKTEFYDYKTVDEMDLSGLIKENISKIAGDALESLGSSAKVEVTIDDIFPLKSMLYQNAAKQGSVYSNNGNSYINVPVAFYGGGLNLSTVTFDGLEAAENINAKIDVNWVESYLKLPAVDISNPLAAMPAIMKKTVTVVTGFEPFRFVCTKGNGYLFGKTPQVSALRANLKG